MRGQYATYIVASRTRVLYVGMTNDLERRVHEHRHGLVPGFTSRYNVNRLVWYEQFETALEAIECEKRIKGWVRTRKIELIESMNPQWKDLSQPWVSLEQH